MGSDLDMGLAECVSGRDLEVRQRELGTSENLAVGSAGYYYWC